MLKVSVLLLCFTSLLGVVYCQSDANSLAYMTELVTQREQQLLAIRSLSLKVQRICPDKPLDDIENSLDEYMQCVIDLPDNYTVCSLLQEHIPKCSAPAQEMLMDCLPERSKEIPTMIMDIIKSVSKYVCKSDGEHLLEMLTRCGFKESRKFTFCKRRMASKLQQYQNTFPTRKELCKAMKSMEPCIYTNIEESCLNDIAKESFRGLLQAVQDPCNSYTNEIELVDTE